MPKKPRYNKNRPVSETRPRATASSAGSKRRARTTSPSKSRLKAPPPSSRAPADREGLFFTEGTGFVVGIDPSLKSTGIAVLDAATGVHVASMSAPAWSEEIEEFIQCHIPWDGVLAVACEVPSYGSQITKNGITAALAKTLGAVLAHCASVQRRSVFMASPNRWRSEVYHRVPKFDTKKVAMNYVTERFGISPASHDQAEAICLAAYARLMLVKEGL